MGSMRAILVLATILSFAPPQVSWTAAALSRDASPSISLTAPAASSQLVRGVAAKTDKTFSAGAAVAADRPRTSRRLARSIWSRRKPATHRISISKDPLAPRHRHSPDSYGPRA
jgi:hypothetical protein